MIIMTNELEGNGKEVTVVSFWAYFRIPERSVKNSEKTWVLVAKIWIRCKKNKTQDCQSQIQDRT